MKILYIGRSFSEFHKFKKYLKILQHKISFLDQDGFFDASLFSVADVRSGNFKDYEQEYNIGYGYDLVVVNAKCDFFRSLEERNVRLEKFLKKISCGKALFIGAAEAGYMLPDRVLDEVDVVFKREPYSERNKYDISDENKEKIVPTMIHCPIVHVPRSNLLSKIYHKMLSEVPVCDLREAVYDVGFSGADAAEHSLRRDVWQRIVGEGFTRIGGLQQNPYKKELIPLELAGPRLHGKKYRNALCAAKINLALKGIGEYTFRHQELLYLGAFMMSDASITELELPMPLEEGKHYVTFFDLDDMVEKIHYYLAHEDERLKIAAAGKQLFDEYYDPVKHGHVLLKPAFLKRE